jgi:hypothetical protein
MMVTVANPTSDRISMDFEPINADHAVESVVLILSLNRILEDREIASVRSGHGIWRADLPAVTSATAMVVRSKSETEPPAPVYTSGIEFSHVRPDGTSAWSLKVVGLQIAVECYRYTRWARVWEQMSRLISSVCDKISEIDKNIEIRSVSLGMTDKFRATKDNYDLSTLISRNEFAPSHIFSAGPLWHNHSGWLQNDAQHATLSLLNFDARRESFLIHPTEL